MDLKGSITDINVRICPSSRLDTFLNSLPLDDIRLPNGIANLTKKVFPNHVSALPGSQKSRVELNNKESKLLYLLMGKNESNKKDLFNEAIEEVKSKLMDKKVKKKKDQKTNENILLDISDIEWIYHHLHNLRKEDPKVPFLHELLENSEIILPKNTIIKRNPVLEARCEKLRAQQNSRDYRAMTKGVDNVRIRHPEDTIAYQIKNLNRQLIAVVQFVMSVGAGFLFGFLGLELMIGNLDFGFRLLLGVMCALIIAIAEIYFLAKKLNEEMSIPEMTQIGGLPKFAASERIKPHKD